MSIDEILEEMDELLDKASSMPLIAHKKVVDGDRLRELINDVRLNLPHELKEAKKIESRDILVKSFDNREDLKKALLSDD